jgi:oligopeptidase A
MVCNFPVPVGSSPSLLSFRDVETLFHEFGHAAQHMLTTVDNTLVSGIRGVEWDSVELPSQFMENFCYHEPTLRTVSKHVKTEKPIPRDLFTKLHSAKNYRVGSGLLRQLLFSKIDMQLHAQFNADGISEQDILNGNFASSVASTSGDTNKDNGKATSTTTNNSSVSATSKWLPGLQLDSANKLEREIARTCAVLQPLPSSMFLCGFQHIFAGGYSAGYYSYKWAEVMSADAFEAFLEKGLSESVAGDVSTNNNDGLSQTIGSESSTKHDIQDVQAADNLILAQMGGHFRHTVLALGGSLPSAQVFVQFRGRQPTTHALLKHSGLTNTAS